MLPSKFLVLLFFLFSLFFSSQLSAQSENPKPKAEWTRAEWRAFILTDPDPEVQSIMKKYQSNQKLNRGLGVTTLITGLANVGVFGYEYQAEWNKWYPYLISGSLLVVNAGLLTTMGIIAWRNQFLLNRAVKEHLQGLRVEPLIGASLQGTPSVGFRLSF